MANEATQTLDLLKGTIKPPSNELIDLVAQVALLNALDFYNNPKDVVLPENPTEQQEADFAEANSYLNKYYRIATRIIKNEKRLYPDLLKIVASKLILDYSYGAFANASNNNNDSFWETRVTDIMTRCLEYFIGIRESEKTAYEAIV